MLKCAVAYRKSKYFVDIHQSKTVLNLKEIVSELTGIKPERFSLKAKEELFVDSALIAQYKKDINSITVVNAVITIRVILAGKSFTYSIGESRLIDDFVKDILRLSGHIGDISLHCNGLELLGTNTLLASGIEHNAYLTAVDGTQIKEIVQMVTINYRETSFSFDVDVSNMVSRMKDIATDNTGIKTEHFRLKLDNILLVDSKPISKYITNGNNFTMTDVIITITVVLNKKSHIFLVKEEDKIEDFKEEIITKTEYNSDVCLIHNSTKLIATSTLSRSDVKHNDTIVAMKEVIAFTNQITSNMTMVTVEYRSTSYAINIDPERTIAELKEVIYGITNIAAQHFCLRLDMIVLDDKKTISKYVSEGTNFVMVNVTIKVFVTLNGRIYNFSVKETMKIYDFKKEIIKKTGYHDQINLTCNNQPLLDTETLLSSEVEHNASILVVAVIRGG